MRDIPPVHGFYAKHADDPALRRLQREQPSGGGLQLALLYEPSFFDALDVEGSEHEVGAWAAEPDRSRIVGMGVMSFRTAHVNGRPEPEPVGYLSALRIAPEYRGGSLLHDTFELARARRRGRARLFLMVALEDNVSGRRALESAATGLSSPGPLGAFFTLTYAVRGDPWLRRRPAAVAVRPADPSRLEEVERFWRNHGRRRQFFPAYTAADLAAPTGLLRGLGPEDLLVAYDREQVAGTFSPWDQRSFRRWTIARYPRVLGALRPLYNTIAALNGSARAPPAGEPLDLRMGACLCVAEDRPDIVAALLSAAWKRLAPGTLLSIGVHERDPLLPLLASARHHALRSRLYAAHWADGVAEYAALDGRVPHVELGAL